MSKKAQPQKQEGVKNRAQGLDEENEPFLKTLQKRVRNINKKLADIAELEAKDNLKPEQVEKVNRKQALLDERARADDTAALFRDTYAENAAHYRNAQLRELEVLARALSIYHSGAKLPENDRLAGLWRVLEQSDQTYPSLNHSIAALSAALKDFANDRKLQKALAAHVELHGAAENKAIEINQEKIVSDILQEKPEKIEKTEVIEPQPKEEVPTPTPTPTPVPTVEVPAEQPKEETVPEVVPAVVAPAPEEPKVAVAVEEQVSPVVAQTVAPPAEGEKRRYNNRDNRDRPYRERRERKEGEAPREKKQYKPRYQEKKPEPEAKKGSSSSSSDSSPEARAFRKEEIRKLEEEGFIVIGKPKPKAKDPKEVRYAHDKQHGKKYHHHHQQPQN